METVEKNVPFTRMEDVENAVWKRLKENDDYRTIQKRFDDMLEAIGRADAEKAFVYDLEEAIGLKEYYAQWEYYRKGLLDGVALLKWMGVLA